MPGIHCLSKNEKNFIEATAREFIRVDGRNSNEFRPLEITVSGDIGSVMVCLGETKVLAQIQGQIDAPRTTRPKEGSLYINIESVDVGLNERGNFDKYFTSLVRVLERTFIDSECISLEALCIKSDEFAWILRVQLRVLNHDGNLDDACSIATLAVLMHYRLPIVGYVNNELHVFAQSEREYLPLPMNHFPVTVTHCIFNKGESAVADPTFLEEMSIDAKLVYGINTYKEICAMNLASSTTTNISVIKQCALVASKRANYLVNLIKDAVDKDFAKREANEFSGLVTFLKQQNKLHSTIPSTKLLDHNKDKNDEGACNNLEDKSKFSSDIKLENLNANEGNVWLQL